MTPSTLPPAPRVGFLHTSPVHVATFDRLMAEAGLEGHAIHVVDEELLADARATSPDRVASRVHQRLLELVDDGADIVCCTCSTLGEVVETLDCGVPVVRGDRPMAARAVAAGPRVLVLATVHSTAVPTQALLRDEAHRQHRPLDLSLAIADHAWRHFEAGDMSSYASAVADVARQESQGADVVVLAQPSLAPVEGLLRDLPVLVFSSPQLTVEHLRGLCAALSEQRA